MTRPKRQTREQAEAAAAAATAAAKKAEAAKQQSSEVNDLDSKSPDSPETNVKMEPGTMKSNDSTTAGTSTGAATDSSNENITLVSSSSSSASATSQKIVAPVVKTEVPAAAPSTGTKKKKEKGRKRKSRSNWHTSSDERMRRSVIEQIMQLLAQCKKSTNQNAKAKLVNLARRLEAALYRAASSKAQYTKLEKDPAVLRQKVRQLARESATKRAILSAATPEAAAAIAATAGASLEEQKKIKEQHLRILRQRQRLLLLRHGSRCRVPIGHKCPVTPHCAVMQKLWQHIAQCKMQQCDYAHCVASRHVLAHYRRCSDLHCLVCGPVRHAAMQSLNAARQQAPHQGYRKPGLLEALGHDQLQQHIQDCRQERLYQLLTVLLRKIVEHKSNREIFNAPVDTVALNIPKYHEIILEPMDLGTIRRKLENQQYTAHAMFAKDCRLVFENARKFNPKTHPVHEAATDLLQNFEIEYFRLVQRIDPKAAEILLKEDEQKHSRSNGGRTPAKSHKKKGVGNHKKKGTLSAVAIAAKKSSSSSSSSRQHSSQQSGRSFEAPRKHGVCTLCQQAVCEQCPMCEAGCLPFEAPALHCRGTCGSRVQRNSSFWALPSTNYFVWCTMCHDNLKPDFPYPIANRTIKKEMLVKKKNNQVQGEPWVQCDMCNKWMHQICVIFNARAEARYSNGRFVCPLCRHKVMAEDAKMREDEAKAALLAKQAAANQGEDDMIGDMLEEQDGETKSDKSDDKTKVEGGGKVGEGVSSSSSATTSSSSSSSPKSPKMDPDVTNQNALKGDLMEDKHDVIPAQSPRATPLGSPRARGDDEEDEKERKERKERSSRVVGGEGSSSDIILSNTKSVGADGSTAVLRTPGSAKMDPAQIVAAAAAAAKDAAVRGELNMSGGPLSSPSASASSSSNDFSSTTSTMAPPSPVVAKKMILTINGSSGSTSSSSSSSASSSSSTSSSSSSTSSSTTSSTASSSSSVKPPAPSPRVGPPATPRTADTAAQKLLHGERPQGSRELPQSPMGAFIEKNVRNMIKTEVDAATQGQRPFGPSECMAPEEIVIRSVSNIHVPHSLPERLAARTIYPKNLNYQSKAVMMFQRDTSDIDQALFAMYVQEYDDHSDGSNKRMAYIAYLDSVSYMRPKKLRTKIYHQIILAYFEWIKARGFCAVYIWACPPPHKRDDYILHVHPDTQRMPSAERLRRWYHTCIDEGTRSGLVHEKTTLYSEHLAYHFLTTKERAKIKQKNARSKSSSTSATAKRLKLLGNGSSSSSSLSTRPTSRSISPPPPSKDQKNTRKRTRSTRSSGGPLEPPLGVEPTPVSTAQTKAARAAAAKLIHDIDGVDLGLGPPPARIPYFDGDFWPIEAEDLLLEFHKENAKRIQEEKEAKEEEGRSTRKKRRVTMTDQEQSAEADQKRKPADTTPIPLEKELRPGETIRMFEKLATRMSHMKRDFLLVKLQPNCVNCHEYIISGNRYSCEECSAQGKPFNLCETCHEEEENRMAMTEDKDGQIKKGDSSGNGDNEEEEKRRARKNKSLHRSRVEYISVAEAEAAKEQAARSKNKKRKSDTSKNDRDDDNNTKVSGAMELSEDVSMKWDPKIHTLTCIEVTKEKEAISITDTDEVMDSPILNTRLALLGVCQGNRYQFDQRRRAKHSTMMLLYHLHNPTVPLYLYTCNECQSDILSGFRWHCPICPDFDLCHECKRGVVHQHQLECHKVKVSADSDNQAQQRSLNLFLESLVHNTTCHQGCEKPECRKITELLRHRQKCRVRASGGCDTCHRILCLLQMHARRCEATDCKVLYCDDLKKRIKENQRRKPASQPVVIHTGSDNAAKPKIAMT